MERRIKTMITTTTARRIAGKILGYGQSELDENARKYLVEILLTGVNAAPLSTYESQILDFLGDKLIAFANRDD